MVNTLEQNVTATHTKPAKCIKAIEKRDKDGKIVRDEHGNPEYVCGRPCPYQEGIIPGAEVKNYSAGPVCGAEYDHWSSTED